MDRLTRGWVDYLRNNARQQDPDRNSQINNTFLPCTLCGKDVQPDLEAFQAHVSEDAENHAPWDTDEAIEEAFKSLLLTSTATPRPDNQTSSTIRPTRKRPSGTLEPPEDVERLVVEAESEPRVPKKSRSPPASSGQQRNSSPPTPSHRSRARQPERDRGHTHKNVTGRQLWNPEDGPPVKGLQGRSVPLPAVANQRHTPSTKSNRSQPSIQSSRSQPPEDDPSTSEMVRQPETRPISQDQLVAEVKGIYAGLVMVETKCIEVDNAQSSNTDTNAKLNNEQWQALIALHRTLLHEHHDFFLASQHPSASPALRRLASKYAMPARMWRHGIHSFLELLRHKLPASLEHMLTFLYLAYSMMALLYETVPAFEDTWIECLGDLGRYRMAIEDDDIRDREVWTGVSRHWYSKASDKAPTTGRLYHHLAILARPNALQQLYYYAKSLCVPIPFLSAKESVMTLFDPVLGANSSRLSPIDASFVRVHAILFSGKSQEKLDDSMDEFLDLLDNHIGRTTKRWLESGYFIGIALSCSLMGYGAENNVLMRAMAQRPEETDVAMDGSSISEILPGETFDQALSFTVRTVDIVLRRYGDPNTLPFLHTTLAFVHHMTRYPAAIGHLEGAFPWKLTAQMLNSLLVSCDFKPRIDTEEFPRSEKEELPRPLPEDFAMRGLLYAEEDYFPKDWFSNEKIDEDEKYFELASMINERKERILWLGRMIASKEKWLTWDDEAHEFSVVSKYDVDVDVAVDLDVEDVPPLTPSDTPPQDPPPKRTEVEKSLDSEVLPDAEEQWVQAGATPGI
ncbi:hypothetical protein G7046_g6002 [Stylonectria norvegica]|nr:hypothetical protein G7046_g6002 [Stylonectria norvegica]